MAKFQHVTAIMRAAFIIKNALTSKLHISSRLFNQLSSVNYPIKDFKLTYFRFQNQNFFLTFLDLIGLFWNLLGPFGTFWDLLGPFGTFLGPSLET